MRNIVFAILGIFFWSACANSDSLAVVEGRQLVMFLNRIKILHEERTKYYKFRAFSIYEPGECDGSPASCPKMHFYLAVSTIDLAPDQNAYELPLSHRWEITGVSEIDSPGEYQRFIVVTLIRKIPSNNTVNSWWVDEKYVVKINPWQSFIERVD